MKKIYALILLSFIAICNTALGQYEDEILILNKACNTQEDSLESLFSEYEYDSWYEDGIHTYSSIISGETYSIEYTETNVVASYIEDYNKNNLSLMKESVDAASSSYTMFRFRKYYTTTKHIYLVSSYKLRDKMILITATNNL
jgi:hypothetical protein